MGSSFSGVAVAVAAAAAAAAAVGLNEEKFVGMKENKIVPVGSQTSAEP